MPNPSEVLINNIKKVMHAGGITQADLAKHTGIAQSHISAYLNRKNTPGIDTINAMAKALGVPISALFKADSTPVPVTRPPTEEELMGAIIERSRLSKEKKELILGILSQS